MRILKPGEPCPCCGTPIRGGLSRWKLLLLSYIAEGLSLMDAINALAEVMELPPLNSTEAVPGVGPESPADKGPPKPKMTPPTTPETEGEEKRAIVQRLKDYRSTHGLGSLEVISRKTAYRTSNRISSDALRMLLTGDLQLSIDDWRKIGRALDQLEERGGTDG